ncbi:MAG TPA: DinB family protein [Gemmatimonadaceae bacterium]|nr:DinB family protein [Gemmatimonadaceae bacterium]
MPNDVITLRDDLERVHAGDPWYGSSRTKILSDVAAQEASKLPSAASHSIWQLVLHMEAWTREVTRRFRGNDAAEPEMGDWPEVRDTSDAAWKRTLESLDEAHRELIAVLEQFPEGKLDQRVGDKRDPALGTGVTYAGTLRGLAQHDAYHTGQIAIVKKIIR